MANIIITSDFSCFLFVILQILMNVVMAVITVLTHVSILMVHFTADVDKVLKWEDFTVTVRMHE